LHSSPRRQSQAAKGGRTEYAPVAVPQRECRDFSLPTGLTPAQRALCPNLNFGFVLILILVGDRIHLCAVRDSKVPLGNCACHKQHFSDSSKQKKAMFQMLGVFAEFERAMIAERVRAGLARARSEGKRLGRPPIAPALEKRIPQGPVCA